MSQIKRTALQRRVDSFVNRRRGPSRRESTSVRLAGRLFNLNLKEQAKVQETKVRQKLQSVRPVGVGFGERDSYGPDNSWNTVDELSYTPYPAYYRGHENYEPPVGDL